MEYLDPGGHKPPPPPTPGSFGGGPPHPAGTRRAAVSISHAQPLPLHILLSDCAKWLQEVEGGEYIMICGDLDRRPTLCSLGETRAWGLCKFGHFAAKKSKPGLHSLCWGMLGKTVNQPTANPSGSVCYVPDVVVVTAATHFGNISHNTHGCHEFAPLGPRAGCFPKGDLHLLRQFVCAQLCIKC